MSVIVKADGKLATREHAPVTSLLEVISRAASDQSVDIEKMERLMQMHERMQKAAAESAFNEALTEAQSEMRPISADATNPQTRSKYASYGQLDKRLRPIYTRHSLSLSFDTGESPLAEHVRVLCYVARGGFSRTYHIDMPADGKGAKGGDVMTKTHAAGAAVTYGMRYLLKMIFNVAVGEDDNDGNEPEETINNNQYADLKALLTEVNANIPAFLKVCKIERLEDLPARKYKDAMARLEEKRRQS
jgi:hypothetical protein